MKTQAAKKRAVLDHSCYTENREDQAISDDFESGAHPGGGASSRRSGGCVIYKGQAFLLDIRKGKLEEGCRLGIYQDKKWGDRSFQQPQGDRKDMGSVFVLQHIHEVAEDVEDTKFIGVYSSEALARAAVKRLSLVPGFCDAPAGFSIEEYEIDRDHWVEGFVTVE